MARPRVKKIDNVFWGVTSGIFSALGAGGTLALNAIAVGTQAATLLRVRGEVLGYLDAVQTPPTGCRLSMGLILVPEGTGSTVVYDPALDSNAPWLWYAMMHLGYEEYVTDVIDTPLVSASRLVVDNKAMRRIRPDVEVQFVVNNTTTFGATPANLAFGLRILQGF